jgi:hypothetical protein
MPNPLPFVGHPLLFGELYTVRCDQIDRSHEALWLGSFLAEEHTPQIENLGVLFTAFEKG